MYRHKTCGGDILVDLSNAVSFKVSFSVGQTLLRISMGEISLDTEKNSITPEFTCTKCKEDVPISEIEVRCYNCGTPYDLDHLWKVKNMSGLYCHTCTSELAGRGLDRIGNEKILASKIFSKISLVRR